MPQYRLPSFFHPSSLWQPINFFLMGHWFRTFQLLRLEQNLKDLHDLCAHSPYGLIPSHTISVLNILGLWIYADIPSILFWAFNLLVPLLLLLLPNNHMMAYSLNFFFHLMLSFQKVLLFLNSFNHFSLFLAFTPPPDNCMCSVYLPIVDCELLRDIMSAVPGTKCSIKTVKQLLVSN